MTFRHRLAIALSCAAVLLTACGGSPQSSGSDAAANPAAPSASAPADGVSGDVAVFAAASLTESFTEIGAAFQAANPDAVVTFNFGASSALAQQITSGAPADVFAAASPATMATVIDAGDAEGGPIVFVRNRLQIAVPAGNPGNVTGLADLADAEKIVALCAEQVPCGAAAIKAFAAAGISPAPDTLEQDVKATVTKVELGEVDAALVYRTDVQAAGNAVEGIDFPEAGQAVNDYPVVTLAQAPNAEAARAFLDYVVSPDGRKVLEAAGFERP